MRILWFTNVPVSIDESSDKQCASGGWMVTLLHELVNNDFEIAVVTTAHCEKIEKEHSPSSVTYYKIPVRYFGKKAILTKLLGNCEEIIQDWQPDIIHIHGTERFYGLINVDRPSEVPTVISIQGLLGPYSEWYHFYGTASIRDIISMHRIVEPIIMRGMLWNYIKYKQGATRERRIIQGNKYFLGRTLWDKAHIMGLNKKAQYFHVGEILREPFWNKHWELAHCKRYRIIFTNAGHPRKGTELLINAVRLLIDEYPDIELCIAGQISYRSGYGRYLRKKLKSLGKHFIELGPLNAEEMAEELVAAHVFVSPSFIDNSPNAVCEAQLVGMPVVASYTGGLPSLVSEGNTGLFFPNGDFKVLAEQLRNIFTNDQTAVHLGRQAHVAAKKRHDRTQVVEQLINAYLQVAKHNAAC